MDSILLSSKNRSSITMTGSKLFAQEGFLGSNDLKFEDQLAHTNCNCYHCINDTKPIQQPAYTRIKAEDEFHLGNNQAFVYLVEKMTEYFGNLRIPDTFIAHNSSIAYISSHKIQVKVKHNVALSEIKKYFDARRLQYNKIIKAQNNDLNPRKQQISKFYSTTENKLMKKQSFVTEYKKEKEMKEIAFVNYNEISSQIVTEQSLNKYLAKRKNDPFWEEIASISLIPPYREDELTMHSYFYERTEGNIEEMQKEMERVSKIIDEEDRRNEMSNFIGNSISENADKVQENFTELLTTKTTKFSTNSPKNLSSKRKPSFDRIDYDENYEKETLASISKEIVAYLEVKFHIRISSCLFKYIFDYEGNFYFTSVEKFIAANLRKNELKIVHDRFTELYIDDSKELMKLKVEIEQNKHKILQNSLADLVVDCLEKRKTELMARESQGKSAEECIYHRLSNENLIKIFKKIFPNFDEEQIFLNPNWQNEYKVYVANCHKQINKVIREDEGIRILKRFGIVFYRTWD